MAIERLQSEDNKKLKRLFEEGVKTLQAIQDLRESLKDTVTAHAEELDIKPAILNKAIKAHFKDSFEKEKESVDEIGNILDLIVK